MSLEKIAVITITNEVKIFNTFVVDLKKLLLKEMGKINVEMASRNIRSITKLEEFSDADTVLSRFLEFDKRYLIGMRGKINRGPRHHLSYRGFRQIFSVIKVKIIKHFINQNKDYIQSWQKAKDLMDRYGTHAGYTVNINNPLYEPYTQFVDSLTFILYKAGIIPKNAIKEIDALPGQADSLTNRITRLKGDPSMGMFPSSVIKLKNYITQTYKADQIHHKHKEQ